jgi:hypothetical protein
MAKDAAASWNHLRQKTSTARRAPLHQSGHERKKGMQGMQGKETAGVVPLPYGEPVHNIDAKPNRTKYISSV